MYLTFDRGISRKLKPTAQNAILLHIINNASDYEKPRRFDKKEQRWMQGTQVASSENVRKRILACKQSARIFAAVNEVRGRLDQCYTEGHLEYGSLLVDEDKEKI